MVVGTGSADEPGYVSKVLAEDRIVVAASGDHAVFKRAVTLRDLCAHRWALQPPGLPTRDWLDHTFDRRHLPRPQVQVETTSLLMLPALIVQTGLLSFISRHHLQGQGSIHGLKEVPVTGATMRRRLAVTYRDKSFLSPAAGRLIDLFVRAAA